MISLRRASAMKLSIKKATKSKKPNIMEKAENTWALTKDMMI